MLKVSEAASLALHAAAFLAGRPGEVVTTGEVASVLDVSENHLSKVLQRLAKAGLVRSTRGPRGGFMLSRSPDDLTLLEVYEAIEGPLGTTNCLFSRPVCNGECILGDLLTDVNARIRARLTQTKLSAVPQLAGVK